MPRARSDAGASLDVPAQVRRVVARGAVRVITKRRVVGQAEAAPPVAPEALPGQEGPQPAVRRAAEGAVGGRPAVAAAR